MLTAMPGSSGRGIEITGHQTISREVSRAWNFRQWQSHHRVQMLIPIHQLNRSSIRRVRVVTRWQEADQWQACMTQERMSSGT